MTKKKKPSKKKKKTVVNSHVVSYPTPISSTNAPSEGGGIESMSQQLCRNIDELAFSGPGNFVGMDDYHAWCIDKQGVVHDYHPEILKLKVKCGTTDIVRKPFTGEILSEKLVHFEQIYDACLQGMIAEYGGTIEDAKKILLAIIHTPLFPRKNCYIRAKLLFESDPQKYSLVIGSLGFRQADGKIYWEYG
jgi:hypothetical protein